MKIFTKSELDNFYSFAYVSKITTETDESGQIILYTNMFEWKDGTVRDQPEPRDLNLSTEEAEDEIECEEEEMPATIRNPNIPVLEYI